jgi:phosphotransferase system HPr-like phosphotransfer protein
MGIIDECDDAHGLSAREASRIEQACEDFESGRLAPPA